MRIDLKESRNTNRNYLENQNQNDKIKTNEQTKQWNEILKKWNEILSDVI